MTKICLIIENHWRAQMGGAPYQGRVIAECLAARPELEIYYLARRCVDDGDDPYEVVRVGDYSGIRHRALFFDMPDLYRTLERIAPDVVYQRMRQSYTAVAAHYARKHGKRFVFHAALDYDVMRGHYRRHLSLNTPFDWVEGRLGEYGLRRADAIVTQTGKQARLLADVFGLDAAAVIPNMHPEPEKAKADRKPTDRINVAWVANLKRSKRPELFVQLAEDLRGDPRFRFIMAGRPGHARTYAALHEQIQGLPNLDYLGEISHERVGELLAESHFLVNTSIVEGFSNTFIEAWMRDAIVLSMNADVDQALARGELGFMANDLESLKARLSELTAADADNGELIARARRHAFEQYGTGNVEKLLDVMLPERAAGRRLADG